ncbi:hypothetical protein J5N97_010398 [Dioscorea zingiberensis]|uniref:Uncharacterized protein n=1 Tax=Dioscorea zingiberensis TaxID=325984 RepID=A0A9D5HMM3_9LILI|nr:hypothetical protein J5N97_010398 [Dioscorea zingiberensis]
MRAEKGSRHFQCCSAGVYFRGLTFGGENLDISKSITERSLQTSVVSLHSFSVILLKSSPWIYMVKQQVYICQQNP